MNSSLHSETAALDILEAKIERLERQIYDDTRSKNIEEPVIKTLLGANTMLNAAANSHKNVQSIYRRLPELNTYLTEETLLEPAAEFERKLNLILILNEDYLAKTRNLEKIAELQSSLDNQNLKSLNELKPLLTEVLDDYLKLNRSMMDKDSMKSLVASGQQLVQEVFKSLAATNTALSQVEIANQKK